MNDERFEKILCTLLEKTQELIIADWPNYVWDDNEYMPQKDGHWGLTLQEMINASKEVKTNELTVDRWHVTCLSLSRDFGKTPHLRHDESLFLFRYLWPNGNDHNYWLSWEELWDALQLLHMGLKLRKQMIGRYHLKKEELDIVAKCVLNYTERKLHSELPDIKTMIPNQPIQRKKSCE